MGKKTDSLITKTMDAMDELASFNQRVGDLADEYRETLDDIDDDTQRENIAKLAGKTLDRMETKRDGIARTASKALEDLKKHVRGKNRAGRESTFDFIDQTEGLLAAFA
ncbi:MAG: hypothetical protein AAGK04_08640 [Planctomycetota bacterium]